MLKRSATWKVELNNFLCFKDDWHQEVFPNQLNIAFNDVAGKLLSSLISQGIINVVLVKQQEPWGQVFC